MTAHSRKHGGAMVMADLASHTADWVEPLAQDYRGYTLHEIPPTGKASQLKWRFG
jgi:gamma-glutamyltranspeptidase/glutathione hydrolase